MKQTSRFAFLIVSLVSSFALAQTAGPKISRVVALRPLPVFERVEHPAPAAGRKLVVFEVPSSLKSAFENDELHVGVVFSVVRDTDDCNETKLYGRVIENEIVGTSLKYFALEMKPGRISKTLKMCNEIKLAPRKVEIATELRALRAFRDTQVFDVPEDVTVDVTVYSPAMTGTASKAE